MKHAKSHCDTCEFKGYSLDFCRLHSKHMSESMGGECRPDQSGKSLGRTIAVGAGAGVLATVAGVTAAPALGLWGAVELAVAIKIGLGAGVAGAVYNAARKKITTQKQSKKDSPKKSWIPPLYLKGR
ncbi:MAG: hypothetical protein HQK55_11075 [Deltaproteobacteria bacterium]|nr:hypothetical protein [Deltaproteobacteria bacterium]